MRRIFFRLFFLLCACAVFSALPALAGGAPENGWRGPAGLAMGQMRPGRYYGYLKMDGRSEKIALQADFFLESPDELAEYPRMEALVKLSLGGYHTAEYSTAVYKTIRFNPDDDTLALDEPTNDLVFSLAPHATDGAVHLQGKVWSRSSAANGTVSLQLETDEPGEEPGTPDPNDKLPFAPLLDGQYEGKCDGQRAIIQLQTAHGLRKRDAGEGRDFFDYEITGRVGTQTDRSEGQPWNGMANFSGGSYDPFRGRLFFNGPSSTSGECSRAVGRLHCEYRIQIKTVSCDLARPALAPRPPATSARGIHLSPSEEQRKELPLPGAASDTLLASLLEGDFRGYLHHEELGRYQPLALHVNASISTENPHNPNKVFVSGTSVLYFGKAGGPEFFSQRYEPRSFYLRPGFALNAPGTDSFLMIEEWKAGFVRGTWYSQSFGRVGTFELVKGDFPALPAAAKTVPGWQGEFSYLYRRNGISGQRWFRVISPNQPAERLTDTLPFSGSFQVVVNATPIEAMERGAFDPYTLAFGFAFSSRDRGGLAIVSGSLAGDGSLLLYWPPVPNLTMTYLDDYRPVPFRKAR